MRTKTLMIAAAALAVGVITSQAQVYSQNIVGYINLNLVPGYNMVANQLDVDGNRTNNNVNTLFGTNLLLGTSIFAWQPGASTFTSATWSSGKGGAKWAGDTNGVNVALANGQGVFIQSPDFFTNTFVGTVVQGTNVNTLTPGYNLVSALPAIAGGLQTQLNYVPVVGDTVFVWDPAAQGYTTVYNYASGKGGAKWTPSEPQISVGQAVFIQTAQTGWTNTFSSP